MYWVVKLVIIIGVFFYHTNTQSYDKWIVVTTINYPTPALKKLAQLPDWRLVVVADKKTPTDWHLGNCDFLSVEVQQQLPYKIIPLLPWNHYSRKNIGYLYAIEHGATIIYETDDDNLLIDDTITYYPEYITLLDYASVNTIINPYAFFGQATVWPRGYPLQKITTPQNYSTIMHPVSIPIQQGLANLDPDVDAIFRLTHKEDIIFENNDPLCLASYTMSPFNTQNTIFYYQAFWGLLLPITTSFRVCDIWRGYWVQRLLWDLNASLCFFRPTVCQYRNEHNLLSDFKDELDLYLRAESLITLLCGWHSVQSQFEDRITEIIDLMIAYNFFKTPERGLMQAWLEDLRTLQYTMPTI